MNAVINRLTRNIPTQINPIPICRNVDFWIAVKLNFIDFPLRERCTFKATHRGGGGALPR